MDAIELSNRMSYVHENGCKAVAGLPCTCVTKEARATITRLTEENAELVKQGGVWVAESLRLTEENKRFREALEKIARLNKNLSGHIARTALVKGEQG